MRASIHDCDRPRARAAAKGRKEGKVQSPRALSHLSAPILRRASVYITANLPADSLPPAKYIVGRRSEAAVGLIGRCESETKVAEAKEEEEEEEEEGEGGRLGGAQQMFAPRTCRLLLGRQLVMQPVLPLVGDCEFGSMQEQLPCALLEHP